MASGRRASLTIEGDPAVYRRDLVQALASDTPPDVCLIAARDFSGTNPAHDFANATPNPGTAPRAITAFTVDGDIKAVPDEFSVDVLFYNLSHFDQAAIGYPAEHWTWDMLEADARALDALKLKNDAGQPVYPLELPSDFDLWNILCTEAGHPALDLGTWHLTDAGSKDSQMRALDLMHELFRELNVTAPLSKNQEPPGSPFRAATRLAAHRALGLCRRSPAEEFLATPSPCCPATSTGPPWRGSTAGRSRPSRRNATPHWRWPATLATNPFTPDGLPSQKPAQADTPDVACSATRRSMTALLPRIDAKTSPLAEFLDQQINQLARSSQQKTDDLYTLIPVRNTRKTRILPFQSMAAGAEVKPSPKVDSGTQLRGL